MGSVNSSSSTRERAKTLANQIGSNHMTIAIDDMVEATNGIFTQSVAMTPRFRVHGGSSAENLALQNVQARCRMVLSYLYAQLTPWSQGEEEGGGREGKEGEGRKGESEGERERRGRRGRKGGRGEGEREGTGGGGRGGERE